MASRNNSHADHGVHLRFLGAPVVEHDGDPIGGLELRKGLALLGHLSVRDMPIPRSELAELFWEGQPEARSRNSLRQVLHTLTTALPGCLTVDRQTVRFARSSAVWVDVWAFEKRVASRDIASMSAAVELYRGEFMTGLFLDDCADFEAWLATEREHWQQRVMQVLTTLIARTTEQHDWESNLRFADRLLALDSWQEDAHRQKMTALARMGQRAAALAQYETCRRVLSDAIGVEPSADTTELYERIRSGLFDKDERHVRQSGRGDAPALPHNLPTPPTPLLGRDEVLAQVKATLTSPTCRLLTLTGPPGIGKTRLSLQAASELLGEFPDGICFVDLAPVSEPGLVVDVIARALDIREFGAQSLLENLQAHLQGRRVLLLLDNFEQVLVAAPLVVAELLAAPGCADLKMLITSRAVLHLRGEHEFELQPLVLPPVTVQSPPDATALAQNPAVKLFTQRAQAVRSDFALTDDTASAVAEICARLDGLPLAIELAAARVKLLAPTALLARLKAPDSLTTLQFLTGGARDLPPRQQTLRRAIAWSHDLLTDAEQRLFHRLGVFVGGWTLEAAEAICGIAPLASVDVLEGLASLVDKSLVRKKDDLSGELRFTLLETIREFAQEQLGGSGEAEPMRQQHARVFTQLAEEHAARIRGPEQDAALNRLEAEHDNVRAALRWSLRSPGATGDAHLDMDTAKVGLKLAVAASQFWYPRAYLREGRDWLELALLATSGDTPSRGDALLMAGLLAFRQGDFAAAWTLESQSLSLWQRLGDSHGVARCHTALSYVSAIRGDHEAARDMLEESIVALRDSEDELSLAIALHVLGLCWYQDGDLGRARPLFEESLSLLRATGDVSWIALPLGGLGRVAYGQGDLEGACVMLEEALHRLQAAGDRPQMASTLFWLGQVARLQGNLNTAAEQYQTGLKLAGEVNANAIVPHFLEGLAGINSVHAETEHHRRGTRFLGAAQALRAAINMPLAQVDRDDYDRTLAALRTQLDEAAFATEWARGRAMNQRQAIDDAVLSPSIN